MMEKLTPKQILKGYGLSAREIEVTEQLVTGKSTSEMAESLFVTDKTVKYHLTNIYKKMKVKSRYELIHKMGPIFLEGKCR